MKDQGIYFGLFFICLAPLIAVATIPGAIGAGVFGLLVTPGTLITKRRR